MSTYVPITGVEVLSAPEKVPARSGGKRIEWRVAVRYLLDNGETIETGDRYSTRRDALARAGTIPANYAAAFDDVGRHIGFRQTIRLGG